MHCKYLEKITVVMETKAIFTINIQKQLVLLASLAKGKDNMERVFLAKGILVLSG